MGASGAGFLLLLIPDKVGGRYWDTSCVFLYAQTLGRTDWEALYGPGHKEFHAQGTEP